MHSDSAYIRVCGDFNGLFGDVLCLSHENTAWCESGERIPLHAGMLVIACCEEYNDLGVRDDLTASGVVKRAPEWLGCHGSKWVLRIDEQGVKNESQRSK